MDTELELITKAAEKIEAVASKQKTVDAVLAELKALDLQFEARMHALEQQSDAYHPTNRHMAGPGFASRLVETLHKAAGFQHLKEGNAGTYKLAAELSLKSLVNEGAQGSSTDGTIPLLPEMREDVVDEIRRPLTLLDVLPARTTTSDSVQFVQMTSDGEASEQLLQGDEKAEINLDGLPVTAYIATIAAHTTVARQVLDDRESLAQSIDNVLRHKVRSRLENQIINGLGGQGKIDGFINQGGPFTPTIGTTPADIIGESLTRQADKGYVPNLVIMNPLDWFMLTIEKTATELQYLFGSPTNPLPPALWNVRVITTPSTPAGTALTVDTRFTTVLDRQAPVILVSTSHKDYFTRNLALILGELRAGLEVLDPLAINVVSLAASSV